MSSSREATFSLWSYGSWIYNYLCNQCLSSLMFWVCIPLMARCYVVKFVSDLWQVGGFLRVVRFSPIKLTAAIITEILLKVVLNSITINLLLPYMEYVRKYVLSVCNMSEKSISWFMQYFRKKCFTNICNMSEKCPVILYNMSQKVLKKKCSIRLCNMSEKVFFQFM